MEFLTNSYDISSATTQQQLQSDPSVDTRELRSSWKWTSRHTRKAGAQTEQPGANVSYQEKTTVTKALMIPSQEKGSYHLLSRPDQVIIVRLRTGNNQRNAHLH